MMVVATLTILGGMPPVSDERMVLGVPLGFADEFWSSLALESCLLTWDFRQAEVMEALRRWKHDPCRPISVLNEHGTLRLTFALGYLETIDDGSAADGPVPVDVGRGVEG